jgi:hypothetical protein
MAQDTMTQPTTTQPTTTQPTIQRPASQATAASASCDSTTRVTKTLLAYGVLAGPIYVVVSLAQALTRDGFELTRHQWSLLSNGAHGWIQITNFVVTGLMMGALAAGARRALRPGRAARWAPRLAGAFGASMIGAGVFRADPALGFPAGTPDDVAQISWHGMLHLACAGVGFMCLAAACLVVAGRFAAEGDRGWAIYSRATGVAFLAGFVVVAAGAGAVWSNLTFVTAVVMVLAWTSAVAARLYRRAARHTGS